MAACAQMMVLQVGLRCRSELLSPQGALGGVAARGTPCVDGGASPTLIVKQIAQLVEARRLVTAHPDKTPVMLNACAGYR